MMIERIFKYLLLITISILIVSCARPVIHGYPGEKQSDFDIATVTMDDSFSLRKVDGVKYKIGGVILKVLPGHHVLTMIMGDGIFRTKEFNLEFVAVKGESYHIFSNPTNPAYRFMYRGQNPNWKPYITKRVRF